MALRQMAKTATVIIIFCWITLAYSVTIEKSAYRNIVIAIDDAVPANECLEIITKIETGFSQASEFLFNALDGRVYFGTFTVIYPSSWPNSCLPNQKTHANATNVDNSQAAVDSDVTIAHQPHPIYGDALWTKQYGGCGVSGQQIYVTGDGMRQQSAVQFGREFVRTWAKYRYGVFDEHGFVHDPIYPRCYTGDQRQVTGCSDTHLKDQGFCDDLTIPLNDTIDSSARSSILYSVESPSISMFCDEGTHNRYAPTKHNFMCDRRSTLDVILKHTDFTPSNLMGAIEPSKIIDTTPQFIYKRKFEYTRYVLVIDETQDMMVRESWSFLRNAIRKWVVYDLPDKTEVGVIMANETGADKVLDFERLGVNGIRDSIASFFPYLPTDTRQQACVGCAVRYAMEMIKRRDRVSPGGKNVLIVIAPGMDFNTDFRSIGTIAKNFGIKIMTINYPGTIRRQPLDPLATSTDGEAFSVFEKKYNSEKTFLATYFELTNILYHINILTYFGNKLEMPIEIHRKEIVDSVDESNVNVKTSKRASRLITGSFVLDETMSMPSGFYIYTHNVEHPLIQGLSVISPSGTVYSTSSDQRLLVKQLTIPTVFNETGSWTYTIQRFIGNPQSHYVQVMATPKRDKYQSVITARSWIQRTINGPIIIYAEVLKGLLPVHSAHVEVHVTRPEIECTDSPHDSCREHFILFDNGSGDPDITKGDGIYTRYFIPSSEGSYRLEIVITDNGNTAYTLADNEYTLEDENCCGSFVPIGSKKTLPPVQRFLPAHTLFFTKEQLTVKDTLKQYGRIGDLRADISNGLKVLLKWTSPDMGGFNVARYEVKYASRLIDLVDNFETAATTWNTDNPLIFSMGDDTTFVLNLDNQFIGRHLYFAVRAFAHLTRDGSASPISNWVHIYIPPQLLAPPQTPYPMLYDDNDASLQGSSGDGGFSSNSFNDVIPKFGKSFNSTEIIILFLMLFFIILFSVIIICIIIIKRRGNPNGDIRKNSKLDKQYQLEAEQNDNKGIINVMVDHGPVSPPLDQQHQQQHYDNLHTIGLPIYTPNVEDTCHYDVDGYTVSKRYSLGNQQQEQQLLEELQAQRSYDGLSIIATSANTLMQTTGRTLSPYESWTATQLLHEHERRVSPSIMDGGEIMYHDCAGERMSVATPTIPPLPPYQSNIVYSTQQRYPLLSNNIQSSANTQHSGINPSTHGSICSVTSSEKKRRNVTMV